MGSKIEGDLGMSFSLISNRGFSIIVDSEREEREESLGENILRIGLVHSALALALASRNFGHRNFCHHSRGTA